MIYTIDFDIVMSKAIELYNDVVDDSRDIQGIVNKYPNLRFALVPDFEIYDAVTRMLTQIIMKTPKDKIFFIQDHDQICELVKGMEPFELMNIDHHHDTGYNMMLNATVRRPDVGNWVRYLEDTKVLTHYTWIYDPTSVFPRDAQAKKYIQESYSLDKILKVDKSDMLIVCESPQWIPDYVLSLFYSWISICEEIKGKDYEVIRRAKK